MDNICCSACFVVAGTRHFLHDGWFYSPSARAGHCRSCVSVLSRPERDGVIWERKQMKPITMIGIALLILGVLALAYQGINYTSREKVLDIGPLQATAERQKRIPLPPVMGGLALAGGIALLIAGARQKA